MSYYIYTNWQAGDKATDTLHKAECGDCQNGNGNHPGATAGLHGVWIGSFNTRAMAGEFHRDKLLTGKPLVNCSHCESR